MNTESLSENRMLLESYIGARQRLFLHVRKLEAELRRTRDAGEIDHIQRRLLLLYGELDDTACAVNALRRYCEEDEPCLS